MTAAVRGRRPLNVAVLGLGNHWRNRYGPALEAMREHFRIRAVCDPVQEWADQEARRLGCVAAAGPTELLETESVDALLLLDAPWYRLWPVELACRFGKPTFCAAALRADDPHTESLLRQVREKRLPVMTALTPQFSPAATHLQQLIHGPLGPVRLLTCEWQHPLRPALALQGSAMGALLNWCAHLFGAEPRRVTVSETKGAGLVSLLLAFPDRRAAQVTRLRVRGQPAKLRLRVIAEKGQATVLSSRRLSWADATGRHRVILPSNGPSSRRVLECFYEVVLKGEPAEPALEQMHRALPWLRAIARSRAESRGVEIVRRELRNGE